MNIHKERGIALVLALFLMSALSVIGASLMFLSQSETYASMNYRMMSQARYAAEAGVQKASNFLLDPTQNITPTAADLLNPALCNRNVSPVTCNGLEVILSASTSKASNYPVVAVQNAYNTAAKGTLASGNLSLTYGTYARLVALQAFDSYSGGQSVVETWEVIADGGLSGTPKATVQILAMIETPKVPASSYAAFGTDIMCGALSFKGTVDVKSYDSTLLSGATVPDATHGNMTNAGGDVGTNGNLTITGSADVGGKLYTPRTGVGACTNGADGAIDGLTEGGSATVTGGMVKLPTAIAYPTPSLPGPSTMPDANISNVDITTCATLVPAAQLAQCSVNIATNTITLTGGGLTLPSVTLSSHVNLVLTATSPAAHYNLNSLKLVGGSTIGVAATNPSQGVVLGIIGKDPTGAAIASPVDLTGGSQTAVAGCASCSNYDASMLQMVYAGTGELKVGGTNDSVMTVYAPNALFTLEGTGNVYGSILTHRLDDQGNGKILYDRRLLHDFWVVGNPMIGTFTWQRY
ncbi:MAG TPA: pilus assembly PilX N-terminal domain-containing protein [Vicinamibacterales bacterium]|nr:pilus assembly PilX N-terminal domain-containing protein [Vicinamibacterales bacterium]